MREGDSQPSKIPLSSAINFENFAWSFSTAIFSASSRMRLCVSPSSMTLLFGTSTPLFDQRIFSNAIPKTLDVLIDRVPQFFSNPTVVIAPFIGLDQPAAQIPDVIFSSSG